MSTLLSQIIRNKVFVLPQNSDATKKLSQKLHAAGRRLTPQRKLVLDILRHSDDHLDAEAIWRQAHARDQRLNLATVYRTLAVLKEMGLVEQRYFARDHRREFYEAVGKGEHYHFTCLQCGQVIEVETPRIRQARRELSEALGLRFAHACVCFEGLCAHCAAQSNPQTEREEV